MNLLLLIPVIAVVVIVLVKPESVAAIMTALRGFLGNRRELALFVLLEGAMIAVTAILIATLGLAAGAAAMFGMAGLLVFWATRPPPKSR